MTVTMGWFVMIASSVERLGAGLAANGFAKPARDTESARPSQRPGTFQGV